MSSTNRIIARLSLTERMELRIPRRTRLQTLLLTHALLAAAADRLDDAAPDPLQRARQHLRDHLAATEAFDANAEAPPTTTPPTIPEPLRHLQSAYDLHTPRGADLALEAHARILDRTSATLSSLQRPDDDPDLRAAQHIQRRFFPQGRAFLFLPLREQYQHIRSTFQHLAPEDLQALDQLRLRREADEILLLNEHIGALLGVHLRPAPAAPDADPFDDLQRSLGAWIVAILAAFPDPSAEHTQLRSDLLSPLFDKNTP
jgi:hypothetical protein